jgi:putative ABC transport system substrate-binding protein
MRRRDFITLLGGTAVAWPRVAGAQINAVRKIGILMLYAENDQEGKIRATAFQQSLEKLGWIAGRNLKIDYRWGTGDAEWARAAATEMLRSAPEVILANGTAALRAVQPATRSIPIVFIGVTEPVAQGFVASLAHPGGNITGLSNLEPTMGPKWLELLKEIAPGVTRAAVMFNPDNSGGALLARSTGAAAGKFAVQVIEAPVREPAEVEALMTMLGREPGGGLIVPPDPFMTAHRKLIVELAARYRLPAIYFLRSFNTDGGLISYGVDIIDLFRQAGGYVDRILRGAKPADLPVQQPTKFELVINLNTAKALGLTVPNTLLVAADEVIE